MQVAGYGNLPYAFVPAHFSNGMRQICLCAEIQLQHGSLCRRAPHSERCLRLGIKCAKLPVIRIFPVDKIKIRHYIHNYLRSYFPVRNAMLYAGIVSPPSSRTSSAESTVRYPRICISESPSISVISLLSSE